MERRGVFQARYASEAQFETWWWPSARAETCCLGNKYSTTLLFCFDCTILYHLIAAHHHQED